MEFEDVIRQRYSVRSYDKRLVEREKVDRILEAARLAPTAVNYQPFKVYVLLGEEARAKAATACRSTYGAPALFLVCSDERQTWRSQTEPGYTTGEMDASIVCCHMMLEAQNLGLGSCWVRLFSVEGMRETFDLPEYMVPRCILLVGYPSEASRPYRPWHDVYKDVSEISEVL